MKHIFIINPAAGSRDRTESYREKIRAVCESRGLHYEIQVSQDERFGFLGVGWALLCCLGRGSIIGFGSGCIVLKDFTFLFFNFMCYLINIFIFKGRAVVSDRQV